MHSLYVIHGNDQGCRFEIVPGRPLSVGRDLSCSVLLHDIEVSRRHAEIHRRDNQTIIIDSGSSNGVFVNGEQVRQAVLQNGDHVQLGRTLLLFTMPAAQTMFHGQEAAVSLLADQWSEDFASPPPNIVHALPLHVGSELLEFPESEKPSPWLKEARSHLKVMYDTAMEVSRTLDIERLLHRILQLIFEWVAIDRGVILLFDPESRQLESKAARNRQGEMQPEKLKVSRSILDYVLASGEGVLVSDTRTDNRLKNNGYGELQKIRDAICVPMQGRFERIGFIYIDIFDAAEKASIHHSPPAHLSEEHLKLMIAIANQAAVAVEDTRYYFDKVQAERFAAIGQTITVLSHHIKNILQGIDGGSFLIETGLRKHDESLINRGWKIVGKNQGKISRLVLDMLSFSKDREPAMTQGDFHRVVDDCLELLRLRFEETRIELRFEKEPSLPEFPFDGENIHRAIINLLSNAIDAVGEHHACRKDGRCGRIHLKTEWDTRLARIRLIIDDNGPGIPAAERDSLFLPFLSKKKGKGTGIGLSVTLKIVDEHNGCIRIEDAPLGGTRFIMELPFDRNQACAPSVDWEASGHEHDTDV